MLHTLISETVKEYLESGERVPLAPPLPHLEDQLDKVWASNLGTCPLRNFKERSQAEPVLPALLPKSLSTLLRMEQGTRYAEVIQEAMVWKFKQVDSFWYGALMHDRVLVEWSLEDEYVKGRADLLYRTGSDVHVIEIKKPQFLKDDSTPYPTYLFQALAYQFILEALYPLLHIHAHILIATTTGFNLWSLEEIVEQNPDQRSWHLVNEIGSLAGIVQEQEWGDELLRQQHYLFNRNLMNPMPDFANHPQHWLCASWQGKARPKQYKDVYKGATERREKMTVACPYWCHSPLEAVPGGEFEVAEVGYETGRWLPIFERNF